MISMIEYEIGSFILFIFRNSLIVSWLMKLVSEAKFEYSVTVAVSFSRTSD